MTSSSPSSSVWRVTAATAAAPVVWGTTYLVTLDELERAWAAGVWTRACDAKEEHAARQVITSLSETQARARLRHAGIDC